MTATQEATEATRLVELKAQLGEAGQRLREATTELHRLNGHRPTEDDCGLVDEARMRVALAEKQVADIETAIERAKSGTSGVCEKCGHPIDPERRKILPQTTLCVKCRREEEKKPKGRSIRVYA